MATLRKSISDSAAIILIQFWSRYIEDCFNSEEFYMRSGIRLGKIFGIEINVDWSWFFIFLLVTWSLGGSVFPGWHSDWSLGVIWTTAVATSLLFFISILLHELSHSLVAKARGLPVKRITLFLFGGVSNIEREPPSPGTEFLMAVVGPLTSFLLGVGFLFLGNLTAGGVSGSMAEPAQVISQLDPIPTLLLWLGFINIILALFNLIPGFPLDGGRILRSVLWKATGNLHRATRWASGVGQFVAWIFIISGIAMIFGVQIPIFGTGLLNGIWLAFIGWFLNNAAIASYKQIVIRDLLEDVTVSRLMRSDIATIPPDMTVSDLVYKWIMGTDERAFPVVEGGRLMGLVCLEDARKLPREEWERTRVSDIMTRADQLDVVTPEEDAGHALERLTRRDVRQMPVMKNGSLVGLLRRRDIVKWLQIQSDFVTS